MFKELLQRALPSWFGGESVQVYLVCGGRRSGTTLLAAVLSSDPRANPLGQEAQILTRIVETYRWGRENFDNFGQSFFGDRAEYRDFFGGVADRFAKEVSERISPGPVLVLKNPELSKVLLDAAALLPKAMCLATVRDPRDQVASELEVGKRRVAAGIHDILFERRDVVTLARHYAGYYDDILELRTRQPDRIRIVRYEDLVLRTDGVLADLRAVTGLQLPFDPGQSWARVSPLAALHASPSRSDLYGSPVDGRSVGRFERDLSVEEAQAVEGVCGELMESFGYKQAL
jgi:hypothetical protein